MSEDTEIERRRTCAFASCSYKLPESTRPRSQRGRSPQPVFELSEDGRSGPSVAELARRKPVALLTLLPRASVLFFAGAVAGALGKTMTAPLDRLKIIMQVKGAMAGGAIQEAANKGNIVKAFVAIGKQEGFLGYWKGNVPQVLRVIPYSAAQLYGYELFKGVFADPDGSLSIKQKLMAGACAGMFSTLATYPLDTLRLRLAVDPTLKSVPAAVATLLREGGARAFFRGLGPAMIGIAPYMALELASYDSLPQQYPAFARGFTAALLATSCCYPLDTIRRQIQLQSTKGAPLLRVISDSIRDEGVAGFYRGFLPNALKNLPNKGIRLSVFNEAKKLLETAKTEHDEAVKEWREETAPLQRSSRKLTQRV